MLMMWEPSPLTGACAGTMTTAMWGRYPVVQHATDSSIVFDEYWPGKGSVERLLQHSSACRSKQRYIHQLDWHQTRLWCDICMHIFLEPRRLGPYKTSSAICCWLMTDVASPMTLHDQISHPSRHTDSHGTCTPERRFRACRSLDLPVFAIRCFCVLPMAFEHLGTGSRHVVAEQQFLVIGHGSLGTSALNVRSHLSRPPPFACRTLACII
jgi:hypothetical protein